MVANYQVNCRLFRRDIQEPAIEEEQKQLQYPPTSAALSISSPDKRCTWGVYSDISPRYSTVVLNESQHETS
jgi:hypothetical protein